MTWDQVAAFRLARHHLSSPAAPSRLVDVLSEMAGAQSQLLSAAQISLWARIPELAPGRIATALARDRSLVRAWCMRRTVYLLPSRELAVFVRGSARRADRELTWMRGRGFSTEQLEAFNVATLRALDRPRTRSELIERVGQELDLPAAVHRGGGWGNERELAGLTMNGLTIPGYYLLHLAGASGVICAGPSRGNEATFVRADAWLPDWEDVPVERAETELLRRYLAAFGPASVEDFTWWTGLRLRDARPIWARLSEELAPVEVDDRPSWALRADLPELASARLDPSDLHLLPYFDSFLLGHREDRHAVRPEHRAEVYRPAGWVAPVVLHRGRAIATWAHARHGARLRIQVQPFGALPRGTLRGLRPLGSSLARYLGCSGAEWAAPAGGRAPPSVGRRKKGTG